MNVLKNFKFFEGATSASESEILYNPNRGSILTLEVAGTGTFTITVKGSVNAELSPTAFSNLAAINMGTYVKAATITAPGIYAIGIDGVNAIKAVLSGTSGANITVFGRVGE